MRIITGTARGTKLDAPEGLNTRPTAERTKEAVFSAIQFSIEGRNVLDVFSGSGQMALEALSRGARSAVAIDMDKKACDIIRKNADKTHLSEKVHLIMADAITALGKLKGQKFSIVFIDPPYASGLIPKVLERLCDYDLLEPAAYIICESPSYNALFEGVEGLEQKYKVYRQYKYGVAFISILQPAGEGNQ